MIKSWPATNITLADYDTDEDMPLPWQGNDYNGEIELRNIVLSDIFQHVSVDEISVRKGPIEKDYSTVNFTITFSGAPVELAAKLRWWIVLNVAPVALSVAGVTQDCVLLVEFEYRYRRQLHLVQVTNAFNKKPSLIAVPESGQNLSNYNVHEARLILESEDYIRRRQGPLIRELLVTAINQRIAAWTKLVRDNSNPIYNN